MIKKWYLSTPMNGKTEKEIQAALQRGIDWVNNRGEEYHNPYNPANAKFVKGKVVDPKPISMLAKAIAPMDDCTGILIIGDRKSLDLSKGCIIEHAIAYHYGKDRVFLE